MPWVEQKKMIVLLQLALSKHADLPDVPLVTDLAKTDEQRQIFKLIFARQVMGRPYLAPPGLPQDRAEALRNAFMATMRDKDFLAEAEQAKFEITPVAGDAVGAAGDRRLPDPARGRRQGCGAGEVARPLSSPFG